MNLITLVAPIVDSVRQAQSNNPADVASEAEHGTLIFHASFWGTSCDKSPRKLSCYTAAWLLLCRNFSTDDDTRCLGRLPCRHGQAEVPNTQPGEAPGRHTKSVGSIYTRCQKRFVSQSTRPIRRRPRSADDGAHRIPGYPSSSFINSARRRSIAFKRVASDLLQY